MKIHNPVQILLLLVLIFILSSCSGLSSKPGELGRKFDTTHVNDIQIGVHTKETIRQWFGEPYSTGASEPELQPMGCVEGWVYLYTTPRGFLKTHVETLAVYFDDHGKVCSHAFVVKDD